MSFNRYYKPVDIYRIFTGWDDSKTSYKDDNASILKTIYKDNTDSKHKRTGERNHQYFYMLHQELGTGAVIFKNGNEDLTGMKDQFTNRKHGLDFGFAEDPAAMPCTHYDKKKKTIYIYDELYMRELTNDVLAQEVKNRIGDDYVTCDSAEPKSIKELKQYGVKALAAKKGKDSVNHGIQWLQQQTINRRKGPETQRTSSCKNGKRTKTERPVCAGGQKQHYRRFKVCVRGRNAV